MKSSKMLLSLFFSWVLIFTVGCSNTKLKPISKEQIKNVSFEYEVKIGESSILQRV